MQSVKEVLQSLVDDNLVTCEKIGTSNYFWSFPSTAVQNVLKMLIFREKTKLHNFLLILKRQNQLWIP